MIRRLLALFGAILSTKTVSRKVVVDAAVDLTGVRVSQMHFDGCIVTLERVDKWPVFQDTLFEDCLLVGDGWRDTRFTVYPGFLEAKIDSVLASKTTP